jgi:hypothetical protein
MMEGKATKSFVPQFGGLNGRNANPAATHVTNLLPPRL